MSLRTLATLGLLCVLMGPSLPTSRADNQHPKEVLLRQQHQHMLQSVDLLRAAGQDEIADDVAAKAEQIGQQLAHLQRVRENADQMTVPQRPRQQEEKLWRNEVTSQLSEVIALVRDLRNEVAELREEVSEQRRSARAKEFASVDLSGSWKISLPAGFEHDVKISPKGENLYQFEVGTVMRGVYRHRGDRVMMEIPHEKRLKEFAWEFQNKNLLMLVESPPVEKVGSDYRGATLQRQTTTADLVE